MCLPDSPWYEPTSNLCISSPLWTIYQLNLKNDTLRRRFDALKYDLKKLEEGNEPLMAKYRLRFLSVVYDLSIRKLGPNKASETS
jgi:hypothetical protein